MSFELDTDQANERELIQLRGANAHRFCPRLFWLEYVAGEFADNEHTIKGKSVHRRVDKPGGAMDAPGGEGPDWHTRSLWLSDDRLGITGKLDFVDNDESGAAFPVDTKKGRPPKGQDSLWPADRVQLTLQALLLRRQGYDVDKIAVWYHSARKRVVETLTQDMIDDALQTVDSARQLLSQSQPPRPLIDSPKCPGCSLNAICQPDEVNALGRDHLKTNSVAAPDSTDKRDDKPIRRVFTPRDDRLPLYVQTPGA